MISRRAFLRTAGQAALVGAGAPRLASGLLIGAATLRQAQGGPERSRGATVTPRFDEVPPSASGITWVHDNARSPVLS